LTKIINFIVRENDKIYYYNNQNLLTRIEEYNDDVLCSITTYKYDAAVNKIFILPYRYITSWIFLLTFRFRTAKEFNIQTSEGRNFDAFMVLELYENSLHNIR
jgi:hypothetical protein